MRTGSDPGVVFFRWPLLDAMSAGARDALYWMLVSLVIFYSLLAGVFIATERCAPLLARDDRGSQCQNGKIEAAGGTMPYCVLMVPTMLGELEHMHVGVTVSFGRTPEDPMSPLLFEVRHSDSYL
jgi:hypothetical protein